MFFLFFASLLFAATATTQSAPQGLAAPASFSIPQVQADLSFLRRALEEVHPSIYSYTPKDSLTRLLTNLAPA
jgi:hypothetical protein